MKTLTKYFDVVKLPKEIRVSFRARRMKLGKLKGIILKKVL